jgi:hypothetical protein
MATAGYCHASPLQSLPFPLVRTRVFCYVWPWPGRGLAASAPRGTIALPLFCVVTQLLPRSPRIAYALCTAAPLASSAPLLPPLLLPARARCLGHLGS